MNWSVDSFVADLFANLNWEADLFAPDSFANVNWMADSFVPDSFVNVNWTAVSSVPDLFANVNYAVDLFLFDSFVIRPRTNRCHVLAAWTRLLRMLASQMQSLHTLPLSTCRLAAELN